MNASTDFVQAERILRIDGLLGSDQLLAERLDLREGVSELFEGTLQLRAKIDDIKPADIVGKLCDVSLEVGNSARRTWNTLVTNMSVGPKATRGLQSYRLTLRPQLWLLSQRSDCRIWQDMNSVDVCETLLGEHGLPAPVTSGVVQKPATQHYSVQFNESDLQYLCRRLEEDGIFYFFAHEKGKHVLHIASHASGYIGGQEVRFAHGSTDLNHINRFETSFAYTPGVRTARDWNFQTPSSVPEGSTPSLVDLPKNSQYELYEYPMVGGYGTERASNDIDASRVEQQTRLRMQATEADHRRVEAASNTRTLTPGGKVTPYDVANPSNKFDEHVVLAIHHEAVDASYETGGGTPDYANRFLALPAATPATPHRTTPRPRIDGTQVAIVAGPEGEEIHPDEYGRIKLWFPWDRRAKKDGSDTCWVRVMQNWAGTGWGGQVIPRIGMEVMVTYLDGDPDRPVVTGVVPNERQKVPYELPKHKTKSVFRTDSHKSEGFNEISFEDATDAENIALHAQKDQTLKILHNRAKRVDNDQVESVGNNKSIDIGQNHQEKIGGSMNLTVGGGGFSGALGLMGAMSGLMGSGASAMAAGASEVADGSLGSLVGGLLSSTLAGEAAVGPGHSGFSGAARNGKEAGLDQAAQGAALGGLVGKIMPVSGIMNTFVEKAKSDTIGMARTEQIGLLKNTFVGQVQTTTVGKKQFNKIGEKQVTKVGEVQHAEIGKHKKTIVGEEYVIEVGKSKLIMKSDGTVILKGVRFNFEASGPVQVVGKVIDLN